MAAHGETRRRALREARSLLQRYGYHGFSFQQLADALEIKKPSLYEHFESKEDLGVLLILEYQKAFEAWTLTIEMMDAATKIRAFFELFSKFAKDHRKYCPLAMLAAEFFTLPLSIQGNLQAMSKVQTRWLEDTIKQGQDEQNFRNDMSKKAMSEALMAMCIGSQYLSRVQDSPKKIQSIMEQALNFLRFANQT